LLPSCLSFTDEQDAGPPKEDFAVSRFSRTWAQ
jgi:hypothetical protein